MDLIESFDQEKKGYFYFLFQGQVNVPAKILLNKLYHGIEEMPSWNPAVIESKILKVSANKNTKFNLLN